MANYFVRHFICSNFASALLKGQGKRVLLGYIMKNLSQLQELLAQPKNICITTHQNPDADALGSSLALSHYLRAKGHTTTIISSTPYPQNLAWMNGSKEVQILYSHNKNDIQQLIDASDIFFCLDFNVHTRTKDLSPLLQAYNGIKVLIDHHMEPDTAFFNYGLSQPELSSTCEMIYNFICDNNDQALITKHIAECIYAGTMTDTGSFRFSSTSASTHHMVANLMQAGVVPNYVHEQIFDVFPERRLRLLGYVLDKRLVVLPQLKAAYMWLDEKDTMAFDIQQGDTEGFVNYPLGISGVTTAIFVTTRDGEVRMSFRSKGDVDVNQFARTYFNGGGHQNASGGKGLGSVEQTLVALLTALKQWNTKNEL
jgi:bifunctional oligoribonuclease and PAP phosphatase NrnA